MILIIINNGLGFVFETKPSRREQIVHDSDKKIFERKKTKTKLNKKNFNSDLHENFSSRGFHMKFRILSKLKFVDLLYVRKQMNFLFSLLKQSSSIKKK